MLSNSVRDLFRRFVSGNTRRTSGWTKRPRRSWRFRPPVEALEERQLLAVFTVTSVADSGAGSLRDAIVQANSTSGLDTIKFNLVGACPQVISPLSALPTISDKVVIDGYTQPGSAVNTLACGSNADLCVVLDGSAAGFASGLVISAGSSTIRGLVIQSFAAHGIVTFGKGSNRIEGNFIGTDYTGTVAFPNGFDGINISSYSPSNVIGGSTPATHNVISGNGGRGIQFTDATTFGNYVRGNLIGTDATGSLPLGNGAEGVLCNFSSSNTIGGSTVVMRNVISSNGGNAIALGGASNNTVQGNYIGTDCTGLAALPNSGNGVSINANGTNNLIGGTTAAVRNLISGNGANGVYISSNIFAPNTTQNKVYGNYIGTDATGATALPNSGNGVLIDNSPRNLVGGSTATTRNLISGNGLNGVYIIYGNSTGNGVYSNYIGTDAIGMLALPNGQHGVELRFGASENFIGGTISAYRNVISGNTVDGVRISDSGTTLNRVYGNYIGTDKTGTTAVPNGINGVTVADASNNYIGGRNVGSTRRGNVISGNTNSGVVVTGANATGNIIKGNYIGTNATGLGPVPNISDGIDLTGIANANTIGGPLSGEGNVVSANANVGIYVATDWNTIQGNRIGIDASGLPLGNAFDGIYVNEGDFNLIGGTASGEGNDISRNGRNGVVLRDTAADNRVQGNRIVGNVDNGVFLPAGTPPGARNVIGAEFFPNYVPPGASATVPGSNYIALNGIYGIEVSGGSQTYIGANRYLGNVTAPINAPGAPAPPVLSPAIGTGSPVLVTATAAGAGFIEFYSVNSVTKDYIFISRIPMPAIGSMKVYVTAPLGKGIVATYTTLGAGTSSF